MSEIDAIFARVIDWDAFLAYLERWVNSGDAMLRTVVASAIAHLECGHQRPTNLRYAVGDEEYCYLCGTGTGKRRVVGFDLLPETIEFPHPDALRDLPVAS